MQSNSTIIDRASRLGKAAAAQGSNAAETLDGRDGPPSVQRIDLREPITAPHAQVHLGGTKGLGNASGATVPKTILMIDD